MDSSLSPKLIEPQFKYYLYDSLQSCHENRIKIYSILFNIGVLFIFLFFFGFTLYSCYKKKMNPYEKQRKIEKDQEYVLSKIRHYQSQQQDEQIQRQQMTPSSSNLTNLPILQDPPKF